MADAALVNALKGIVKALDEQTREIKRLREAVEKLPRDEELELEPVAVPPATEPEKLSAPVGPVADPSTSFGRYLSGGGSS